MLWAALRLRCIYCGRTPLRRPGAWFSFADGCPDCDYSYEREHGYFTGASWMVNFPFTSVSGFVLAAVLLGLLQDADPLMIALVASVYMLAFGAWFTPYSMALWMYAEHALHPKNAEDKFRPHAEGETPA